MEMEMDADKEEMPMGAGGAGAAMTGHPEFRVLKKAHVCAPQPVGVDVYGAALR